MYARGFLLGLIVGAAIGAGVSLLYAPVTGVEARNLLARKTRVAADTVGRVKTSATSRLRRRSEEIQQAI